MGDANSDLLGISADIDGWFVGGQLGWNWQAVGSPWVFGVEVDSAWSDIGDSASATAAGFTLTASTKIEYLGTARVRVGHAWDRFLPYLTGGVAWASNVVSFDVTAGGFTAGILDRQTHLGWTAGGGFEWMFANNWSAKLEYLYMDLGSETYFAGIAGGFDGDINIHTVKRGLNFHF